MPILGEWDLAVDADKVLWGQSADPAVVRGRGPRLARIAEEAIEEGRPGCGCCVPIRPAGP